MKSYTDIEQSKKLAEILPIESADMYYTPPLIKGHTDYIPHLKRKLPIDWDIEQKTPCWSLAALLSILPKIVNNKTLFIETSAALWHVGYRNIYTARADNPVDACYEMIIKLH
jgi:hypothetical protein